MEFNIPTDASPSPPGRQYTLPLASRRPGEIRRYAKPTSIGQVEFKIPSSGEIGTTVYKIWGSLSSNQTPLICLHGGPGMLHNYILPICLVQADYGIPVVMYDQLGCGENTHLPQYKGDESFWTIELHLAELENLKNHLGIKDFFLLGQSCGGMQAIQYAIDHQPAGLQKLIISNSPASIETWRHVCDALRAALPQEVQDVLTKHETEGTTDSREYEEATYVFYRRHVCRFDPFPEELKASLEGLAKDNTVYYTMNGPSEFTVTGSLKNWNYVDRLHKLTPKTVPGGVLLINGAFDEAQDQVMWPYFNLITARTKWIRFALSSHCPFLEETEAFVKAVGEFLLAE